ncbi:MAG: hypothetical protein QOG87_1053 [Actinomycetota bacterium]|jgi:PAS domain S-box-containing protein
MDREGSPLESLRHLAQAIAASPIPLFVCDVANERILLANSAAADLFGATQSAIIGSPASELWEGSSTPGSTSAISALNTGAIDSYRAHRQITTAEGPMEVSVWARTLETEAGSVAVTVVLPDADAGIAGNLIDSYFGPDAANLAVGTIDGDGRFSEITPNSEEVIGLTREQIAGSELASIVHPEDVDRLMQALRQAAATSQDAAVEVRLRHPDRGWTDVRCLTLSSPPDQPVRLALALAGSAYEPPLRPEPDLLDLERQVLRIAAELHAATMTRRGTLSAEATRYPALDALPPRQREIVDRLLQGERIPTIAASLYLSRSTVRNHLSRVFKTFGVGTQADLLSLLRSEVTVNQDN